MMQVIIVDAESAARRTLRECCSHEPDLRVVAEYSESAAALEAVRANPPDVLFLDVHLTPLTGLALARALDPSTPTHIIFVSAYARFARDAFEVNAADFLVKPFDDARFRQALRRIRRRVSLERLARQQLAPRDVLQQLEESAKALCQPRTRVIADSGGRMHVLDVSDIELVESERNYVKLTVGRGRYTVRCTLQHAEDALSSQPMLKISRSCLVNLIHVRELGRTPRGDVIVLLAGGVTVTTSERYRHSVRQQLGQLQLTLRNG
jgi:two-component system LytT family response regulator